MDYLMVLSPLDQIKEIIKTHKLESAKIIGDYEAMHSVAHISIANLVRQKDYLTEPQISLAEKKLKTLPPIELTIDGFDHFSHGEDFKTIYARIRSTPTTVRWFKELKKPLNVKQYLVPHITIARNIPVEQFNQLWPRFKDARWVETFSADRLTVLHRETFASFANWELYKELPFEGKIPFEEAKPTHKAIDLRKGNYAASQQISLF
ncbi:MAG TPA: 2'-5' RNA ligase family protein [Nitrosopumilaceae archaeon]|nr:2'-5' RNA ligase family protein [Nitrosopumilaceae archaeon]